jgi:hypothetical protein
MTSRNLIKFSLKAGLFGAALLTTLAVVPVARAAVVQTINFDDLPGTDAVIQNGYKGFNWDNFGAFNPDNDFTASGYQNGRVSQQNVAYNGAGRQATLSRATSFDLVGGYFSAAWNDGLSITLIGLKGGIEKFTTTFTVDTTGSIFEVLNWSGIDEVRFKSFGGTHNDLFESHGHNFALDDLQISEVAAVPLPAAAPLFGMAMIGLVGYATRRRLAA